MVRRLFFQVEQMKKISSARIKQGLNDPAPEKRKSWEAIPCEGNVPTPEEWLKYAVEKMQDGELSLIHI